MGKRKRRSDEETAHAVKYSISRKATITSTSVKDLASRTAEAVTVQIITGSYERTLHGITATLSPATSEGHTGGPDVSFADTFLLNAHSSAIRCLALSPPSTSENPSQPAKVILASGGTDERINLYHLSASPPGRKSHPTKPTLAANPINENPRNRELGALLHHSSSVSALSFPSRSKLLSSSEDNTIAVVRTRDWTVLSTIKAPIPKAFGRPSGDTAPPGGSPAGVNDFAVHPSMKLMVSVGKGEKCMRLWNLVTGKKAGVLNFGREILQGVGEGRWGNGDGRKVEWDSKGEEFAVGFERGVVIFGMVYCPACSSSFQSSLSFSKGLQTQMSSSASTLDEDSSGAVCQSISRRRRANGFPGCVYRRWSNNILLNDQHFEPKCRGWRYRSADTQLSPKLSIRWQNRWYIWSYQRFRSAWSTRSGELREHVHDCGRLQRWSHTIMDNSTGGAPIKFERYRYTSKR